MKDYQSPTERVANQLLALMEQGTIPWSQPWRGEDHAPKNLVSGKAYRGCNAIILAIQPFESPWWMTPRQAYALGGHPIRGEKCTEILYAKVIEKKVPGKKEPERIFTWRNYWVLNLEQTEEIEHERLHEEPKQKQRALPKPKKVVSQMPNPPAIRHGGDSAHYHPGQDYIQMPQQSSFSTAEAYYSTLFHELVHSTGHASRLAREMGFLAKGELEKYGKEELIAEVGAAALSHHCGIFKQISAQSAAYLKAWLTNLKQDHSFLVSALSGADKAVDFILDVNENPLLGE